jgi:hypothetical protein
MPSKGESKWCRIDIGDLQGDVTPTGRLTSRIDGRRNVLLQKKQTVPQAKGHTLPIEANALVKMTMHSLRIRLRENPQTARADRSYSEVETDPCFATSRRWRYRDSGFRYGGKR